MTVKEFLKLQKEYDLNETMVLETANFVVSEHLVAIENQRICRTVILSNTPKLFCI